jgi:hypothetical protein
MNLVAFEMLANAVRPCDKVENVGVRFQIKEAQRVRASDVPAREDSSGESGDQLWCGVNLIFGHA